MNLLQPLVFHVRVNLGGGDIDVTQHHLHGPQIGAMFQQMRSERMAQHVAGKSACECRLAPPAAGEWSKNFAASWPPPPPGHEQRRCRATFQQDRSYFPAIGHQLLTSDFADGHQALFVAFAGGLHVPDFHVHRREGKRDQLRDPEGRPHTSTPPWRNPESPPILARQATPIRPVTSDSGQRLGQFRPLLGCPGQLGQHFRGSMLRTEKAGKTRGWPPDTGDTEAGDNCCARR